MHQDLLRVLTAALAHPRGNTCQRSARCAK
jgi:hypothetical protein